MAKKLRHRTVEIIKPQRARSVMLTWGLALGIVLAVNFGVVIALDHFNRDPHLYIARSHWNLLLEKKRDWLIFGDSSCQHGLDPKLFNQEMHADAVNLGTFAAMTLINDAWMLAAYIEKFGPPRKVLMVHTFDVTTRFHITPVEVSLVPQPWGFWKKLTPAFDMPTGDALSVPLIRAFPLYFRWELLRRMMKSPWRSLTNPCTTDADGYDSIVNCDTAGTRADADFYIQFYTGKSYDPTPETAVALNKIRELADMYSMQVYFVNAPLYSGLLGNREFQRHYDAYRRHIKTWTESSPNLHYLLYDPLSFPADKMQCANHTVQVASEEFTRAVARALRDAPSPQDKLKPES